MLPGESSNFQQNSADNGTMRGDSGSGNDNNIGVLSCVPDNDMVFSCHLTVPSLTSSQSEALANFTGDNTSDSTQGTGHEGDTTSEPNG